MKVREGTRGGKTQTTPKDEGGTYSTRGSRPHRHESSLRPSLGPLLLKPRRFSWTIGDREESSHEWLHSPVPTRTCQMLGPRVSSPRASTEPAQKEDERGNATEDRGHGEWQGRRGGRSCLAAGTGRNAYADILGGLAIVVGAETIYNALDRRWEGRG